MSKDRPLSYKTPETREEDDKEEFSVWKRARKLRAEERERARLDVLSRVVEALHLLEERYCWKEAYLFGSLTRPGRFHPDSDVDIAIRGLNKFEHFAFVGDLSMLLQRPVDVLRLEDSPLAESIVSKGRICRRKDR